MRTIQRNALCSLVLCLSLAGPAAHSAATEEAEVAPPQVFQAVTMMREDINQIRTAIGGLTPAPREYRVRGALPKHGFFQAQNTFRNANVLASRLAAVSRKPVRPAPPGDITPADVLGVVNDTRGELALIKQSLGITSVVPTPRLDRRMDPSDVLKELIDADRDLSWMGGRAYTWEENYETLRSAVTYAGGLLDAATRYTLMPPLQQGKFPADVFAQLVVCQEVMRELARDHNTAVIELDVQRQSALGPTVTEVGAMSTIVLAELADLTLNMGGADVDPPEFEYPARIFPAHVFQLAQLLQAQLEAVAKL